MRKTVHALALPVALLLALGLSACNGGQVPVSKSTGSDETTTSAHADSSQEPTERPTTGRPSGRPTTGRPSERPTTETPTAKGRTVQATDLQVGDCYNEPDPASTTTNDDGKRQVGSVEVVDCEVPHQHEVYNNYKITLSTFPDSSTMQSQIQTACYSSFEDYVGKSYDESQYEASTLTPTENSWAQGDRTITCTLVTKDNSLITGSLKGAAK
ncbi:septum formation family protein [Actinomyces sp. oral taxon 414]|uniref:septum formation family protein n=1 Tax=Actinomyces sp. oral taxon 414 TaxID=712122 RepID=UPI0006AF0146|nr:septum formation family protein [Actinomyces sp. oral taxon 414]